MNATTPEAETEDGAHEEPRVRPMLTERMVLDLVPVSRTTLYRLERAGRFPRSVYVSPNRRFWFRGEMQHENSARLARRTDRTCLRVSV